ncbi:MAG TPA: DUF177 domain-containing protein [Acidimicrobiales bacterium]|nr:DUF177 domain-containing protein [Acidimicrobiales bacterium]
MTRSPWLVPVTVLRRSLGNRMVENRSGFVGELRVGDSVVAADVQVTTEAVLASVDGGVEVTASVTAVWSGRCRRCLRPVGGILSPEVRELYRQRHPGEPPDQDEETYPLVGEMLDLRPMVRDALLLNMPIAPLCDEGCRGLCPSCGEDLNEGDCLCPPVAPDPRWAALDVLQPPGGGSSG